MASPLPAGDGASLGYRPTVRYVGRRTAAGVEVVRYDDRGNPHPLPQRFDLKRHSPTGFEWGYGGSGPAQLALAILADAIGAERAQDHACYQAFKFAVVANFTEDSWEVSREAVLHWHRERVASSGSPP